ncbi:MAG: hypothetical protein AAFZ07_01710 [Actinomycetota bacterium]
MRTALLLFASLALVLVSCGDSDDGGSSASAEDWCSLSADFEAIGDDFDALEPTDPDSIRALFDRAAEFLDRARASAPDEISDDVDTFADAFGELDSALRDADFNLLDADLSVLEEAGDRVSGADDSIQAYNERECGIEADPEEPDEGDDEGSDEGDSDFDPSAGSLRDQLVTQFTNQGFSEAEATCLADNLDPSMLDGNESAVLAIFEQCDIDLSRLAELFG